MAPTASPYSHPQPEAIPAGFLQDCRAWVEVDEGAVTHNTRLLRQRIGPHGKPMAIGTAPQPELPVRGASSLVEAGRHGMGFEVSGVNHQDLWLCGVGC